MARVPLPTASGRLLWLPIRAAGSTFATIDDTLQASLGATSAPRVPLAMVGDIGLRVSDGTAMSSSVFVTDLARAGGYLLPDRPWNLDEPEWLILTLLKLHATRGGFSWGVGLFRHARVDGDVAEAQRDLLAAHTPGLWFLVAHPGRPRLCSSSGSVL